jgi:hypothetical protein
VVPPAPLADPMSSACTRLVRGWRVGSLARLPVCERCHCGATVTGLDGQNASIRRDVVRVRMRSEWLDDAEQSGRGSKGKAAPGGVNWHGHQPAVKRPVEQLLPVSRPPREVAAARRHLPAQFVGGGKPLDEDYRLASGFVRSVGEPFSVWRKLRVDLARMSLEIRYWFAFGRFTQAQGKKPEIVSTIRTDFLEEQIAAVGRPVVRVQEMLRLPQDITPLLKTLALVRWCVFRGKARCSAIRVKRLALVSKMKVSWKWLMCLGLRKLRRDEVLYARQNHSI